MQCSCGGSMVNKKAINGDLLRFKFCQDCGRIGDEYMYRDGQLIGRGLVARLQFQGGKDNE